MINNRDLKALAQYLVTLFKMVVPRVSISIHWLPDSSRDLGYTCRRKNKADVYLTTGRGHSVCDGMTDAERKMFAVGVAVHEFMHQILTNFVLDKKVIDSYKTQKEKNLYHLMFNLFEDSRIESFAPSYFAGQSLASLNFTIQTIWEKSDEIDPESTIFQQVISSLIQYGDLGMSKPEMSEEAQEVFDKIIPLFNAAIDSTSCANCIVQAKEAAKILLPYAPDEVEPTSKSESDSEGEDAEDSEASAELKKRKYKGKTPLDCEEKTSGGPEDGKTPGGDDSTEGAESDETEDGAGEDETSESDKKSESDETSEKGGVDGEYADEKDESSDSDKESKRDRRSKSAPHDASGASDGCGKGESVSFDGDGDVDEVYSEGTTEEDFEEAAKSLEKTLAGISEEIEREAEGEKSDYDFGAVEKPTGDKFVKTISHHKHTDEASEYDRYLSIVQADAHELAKLIKRQFKTKPGKTKRSDHGDLNLMRYKDPNFRSPLIFDKKKPKEKHSAAVMLLVDESGSMSGRRIEQARIASIMLAEAMAEAGIPCCIVGHSGDSAYSYSVELEHYTTFKNTKADRRTLPYIRARCQNRDGPAIRWAASQLKKRPERKKLLIVISDGAPCADDYHSEEAIYDTKSAIREAKRLFDVAGIILEAGTATDTLHTMYGDDFVECSNASDLKNKIMKVIRQECKDW